jgi:hypothetical protein
MSFRTTTNFINNHSLDTLEQIYRWLKEGRTQRFIASQIGLSPAQTCELCSKMFKFSIDWEEGAKDAIRFQVYVKRADISAMTRMIGDVELPEAPIISERPALRIVGESHGKDDR